MSKSFRELVEALRAAEAKSKNTGGGTTETGPRAKGEADFAKAHHNPVDPKSPHINDEVTDKESNDALTARSFNKKAAHIGQPGERTVVPAGTKVKDLFGFRGKQAPANRGDNRQGDHNIVKDPSGVSIPEEVEQVDELVSLKRKVNPDPKADRAYRDADALYWYHDDGRVDHDDAKKDEKKQLLAKSSNKRFAKYIKTTKGK